MHRPLFCLLFLFSVTLMFGCSNDDEKEAQFQATVEKTKTVLANQCSKDEDCIVTGCHQNICRAMPEPDYCDQRLVLAAGDASDIPVLKSIIAEQLTVQEADTLRIGGYAAGLWTLSFQADQTQRARVETLITNLSQSGFAKLHPKSNLHTQALYDKLSPTDPDIALRSMKGVGKLLEKQIRSGDVLSKDDIRNTWTKIANSLDVQVTPDDDIERLWAYDVIFGKVSFLRIWPIDKRQRISLHFWKDLETRTDNGDIIISAKITGLPAETFKKWTSSDNLIVLMIGNQIIASALPGQAIEDGVFELVIHDGAKSEIIVQAVDTLKALANLKGTFRIDQNATTKVERDIACQKKFPRSCGCIQGSCAWHLNPDYNACLSE